MKEILPKGRIPLAREQVIRIPVYGENGNWEEMEFQLQVVLKEERELSPPFQRLESLRPPGSYPLWAREEGERFWLWSPIYVIYLDLARQTGEVQLTDPRNFQNARRLIYFYCSLKSDFLLLHASGVLRRGRAFVFPGVSGAGKTTIVRNSPGMAVLTDEMIAVHLGGNGAGVMAHGTQFSGEWDLPGAEIAAPVAGLYFPRHAPENRVTPLTSVEVLAKLLPCVVTYSARRDRLAKVFDLAVRLAEQVRGFQLDFYPDPDFWQMIDGA